MLRRVSDSSCAGDSQTETTSKLSLGDLAGSERPSKTGAQGTRLEEGKQINLSLTALGLCINTLSSAAAAARKGKRAGAPHEAVPPVHVPYRNSKLTYLLQDSLSGDSKALMFVNVSTDCDDVPETLCSLRFAARAHDVALGQAKKNVAPARAASPMGRPPRTPERR